MNSIKSKTRCFKHNVNMFKPGAFRNSSCSFGQELISAIELKYCNMIPVNSVEYDDRKKNDFKKG